MDTDSTLDPTIPVSRQLDAYNARDIDAFMTWWAEDCEYYQFPSHLLARGTDAIRQRHVERFKEVDLHGSLTERIAVGNVVVDREVLTRTFPEGPGEVDVLAIYEVEHGRIAKAWFKIGTLRLYPHAVTPEPAVAGDAASIRSLVRDAYAKWVPVIGREPRPMLANQDASIRDHRVDVIRIDGAIAGVIEMIPAEDHLLIENVAVSPAYQRRGIGRRLLAHAEQVAAALGYPVIRLYTNPLFAGNVRLYESAGYRVDREEPFMGGVTVYMSKRLGSDSA